MKTIISTFILLFSLCSLLNAQITEKEENMSLGVQSASQMVLDDISPKDAVKLWKKYFKEYGKVKRNKKADEYYSTGVRINRIFTASKIDVYTRFEERGSSTTMTMWVDMGVAFVSSADYPSEYEGMAEMMDEFRIEAREWVVKNELEAAEKDLDKMKKLLTKLEKDNVKLHDKIENYEEKIRLAQQNIEQNLIDQEESKINIDKQIEILKQIQLRLESIREE